MASRDNYQADQTLKRLNGDVDLKPEQHESLGNAMVTAAWAGRTADAATIMNMLTKTTAKASMEEAAAAMTLAAQAMASKIQSNDAPIDVDVATKIMDRLDAFERRLDGIVTK